MSAKYIGRQGDRLVYERGECTVMVSGPEERELIGWHFSISCPDRNPTWEEQRDARYELLPDDVYMVSILPPKKDYVTVHEAKVYGEWIEVPPLEESSLRYPCPRGLQIHMSAIAWVADAPEGS